MNKDQAYITLCDLKMTFEMILNSIFMIDMALTVCMSTWRSVVIDCAMVRLLLIIMHQSVSHACLYGYV